MRHNAPSFNKHENEHTELVKRHAHFERLVWLSKPHVIRNQFYFRYMSTIRLCKDVFAASNRGRALLRCRLREYQNQRLCTAAFLFHLVCDTFFR